MATNEPSRIGPQSISVDVTGQTMTDIHLAGKHSVIVICDSDDDGINVYFRGLFATPGGNVSNGSPLCWLWHLAYHLVVVEKRLHGDRSEVTDHDVDMTLIQAMLESPLRSKE